MNPAPNCPHCGDQMVRRTAGRGTNQGNVFWGCPRFPKCRGKIFDKPTSASGNIQQNMPSAQQPSSDTAENQKQGWRNKLGSAFDKAAAGIDKIQRWHLEFNEPDAKGHWDKDHRPKVLKYIYNRDGGRCGLCAGDMKNAKGAQIEHIVPKVFAVFDIQAQGKAIEGTQYKSLLHRLDNLQAAHTYCNKRKGNTPELAKWRHPSMPALGVALYIDGRLLYLPGQSLQNPR